jgi:TPR repeat protein
VNESRREPLPTLLRLREPHAHARRRHHGLPRPTATGSRRRYRKAAEQGDAVGQRSLGYMYASGRGVPQDRIEAGDWYRKAADQGDAYAKRALESLAS